MTPDYKIHPTVKATKKEQELTALLAEKYPEKFVYVRGKEKGKLWIVFMGRRFNRLEPVPGDIRQLMDGSNWIKTTDLQKFLNPEPKKRISKENESSTNNGNPEP